MFYEVGVEYVTLIFAGGVLWIVKYPFLPSLVVSVLL